MHMHGVEGPSRVARVVVPRVFMQACVTRAQTIYAHTQTRRNAKNVITLCVPLSINQSPESPLPTPSSDALLRTQRGGGLGVAGRRSSAVVGMKTSHLSKSLRRCWVRARVWVRWGSCVYVCVSWPRFVRQTPTHTHTRQLVHYYTRIEQTTKHTHKKLRRHAGARK